MSTYRLSTGTVDNLQELVGIKGYDSNDTYSLNDVVVYVDTNNGVKLYQSLDDNNTSSLSDNTKWKEVSLGGGSEIGDIGFAPLGIDESLNLRRYLNGQVISQTQFEAFTRKVKSAVALFPNLGTTESNWQAEKTNSKLGQCGKFVIDDTDGTIRLPCVVNAQGLIDLALIGGIKAESLPNITGKILSRPVPNSTAGAIRGASGAFTYSSKTSTADSVSVTVDTTTTKADETFFDASRSSSTYQDNAPVQQEAIQYPYYIQVATDVEETLPAIREYQINTPFFFGQSMYSDVAPDNASWLASNGQYNARAVYPDYYDWLVEQMNAGVDGFKGTVGYAWKSQTADIRFWTAIRNPSVGCAVYGGVGIPFAGTVTAINPDGTLNFYEVSTGVTYENLVYTESENINIEGTAFANLKFANDYDFVVNTADQTFRLPLLNGEEDLPSDRYDNLTISANTQRFTAPANGIYTVSGIGFGWVDITNETSGAFGSCSQPRTGDGYGRYTVNAKQGDQIAIFCSAIPSSYVCRFIYAKGNGSLYYYVGDTVQDASLINAGAVLGQLSDKISRTAASDKEMVVGWGMPDYTTIIGSLDATLPYDSFVYCRNNSAAGGPDAIFTIYDLSGNKIAEYRLVWSESAQFYIKKGYRYTITGGTNPEAYCYKLGV